MNPNEVHEQTRSTLRKIHGYPWDNADIDAMLADRSTAPYLRELILRVPDLIGALGHTLHDNRTTYVCDVCGDEDYTYGKPAKGEEEDAT